MPILLPRPEHALGAGAIGVRVPGTGASMPPGVESVFEYDGLYINMQQWLERYQVKSIAGFDKAGVRLTSEPNPDTHGSTPMNSLWGDRTMVISGQIRAHSLEKLRDMEQALRTPFLDLIEKPLIIRTGNINRDAYIMCRLSDLNIPEEQTSYNFFRDFQLSLIATNPRFLSYRTQTATGTPIVGGDPLELRIHNIGNFAAEPQIFLTGGITNVTINNRTNDMEFAINAVIPDGDVWTLDLATKELYDQDGNNQFDTIDDNADWIELAPRENVIQVYCDAVSGIPRFDIRWNHTWM